MLVMALLCVCSCGDDDSDIGIPNLFGTWYGEKSKEQITVIFREDKTGLFTYESSYWETNHIYYNIEFTYRISGNRIICQGSTNGADIAGYLWNLTFVYYDKFLIAVDKYDGFYVYKGGIIPEDDPNNGDGNDDSGDNGGSGDGSGDDSSGNGGSSGGSGDDSGNNGSPNGYEPIYALGFGIESAEHFKNGIYQYMIGAAAQYPADAWKNDITCIGFAIDVTNGTLNEYGLKKMDVDRHTWLCLWQSYSDNKAHNFGTTFFVTSREPRVIIEYLPFYDKNNSRISLNWENITLTPTNIREINANY